MNEFDNKMVSFLPDKKDVEKLFSFPSNSRQAWQKWFHQSGI